MPTIQKPKFQLPQLELPKFELPKFEQDLVAVARDAVYATIGLGVLAIQQVQRNATAVGDQLRRYAK